MLLQLMGFPQLWPGENPTLHNEMTVHADWNAVVDRLSTHPEEAMVLHPQREACIPRLYQEVNYSQVTVAHQQEQGSSTLQ